MRTPTDHLHALARDISGSARRRLALAALSKCSAITIRQQLNDTMTGAINKELGTQITMILLSEQWSVSGSEDDVCLAVQWLAEIGLMTLDSIEYDAEVDKTFAYLDSVQP